MLKSLQDNMRVIEATERADVARWFSPSPAGLLFHDADGTARPIAPDAAERWKRVAQTKIDAYVNELPSHIPLGIFIITAMVIILWCIDDLFGFSKVNVVGVGVVSGFSLLHFLPILRTWQMRRQLGEVRAAIAHELRSTAPVPAAIAARYRRRNPWKLVFEIYISLIVFVLMAGMHEEWLIEAVPPLVWPLMAVPAWVLFGLSKYKDAHPDPAPPRSPA